MLHQAFHKLLYRDVAFVLGSSSKDEMKGGERFPSLKHLYTNQAEESLPRVLGEAEGCSA